MMQDEWHPSNLGLRADTHSLVQTKPPTRRKDAEVKKTN